VVDQEVTSQGVRPHRQSRQLGRRLAGGTRTRGHGRGPSDAYSEGPLSCPGPWPESPHVTPTDSARIDWCVTIAFDGGTTGLGSCGPQQPQLKLSAARERSHES